MTAEPIARVVADLRTGRARVMRSEEFDGTYVPDVAALAVQSAGTVVDATAIYRSLLTKPKVAVYEDHPCIAPPFTRADFCYVNEHGNVVVLAMLACDYHSGGEDDGVMLSEYRATMDVLSERRGRHLWPNPAGPVDWGRIRWSLDVFVWLGGRGQAGHFPTAGPMHLWRIAVYEDGAPADIHWFHLMPQHPMERWDMACLVLLGSLTFLNCANVETVEPVRARHEARRIARTGVRVTEIAVRPVRRLRGLRARVPGPPALVPLTSVRGHVAHYGACCPSHEPRGLLFGQRTARIWVPQHARGTVEAGRVEHDYRLVPE